MLYVHKNAILNVNVEPCMRSRLLEEKGKVLEGVGTFIAMQRLKGFDFMD